MIADSASTYTGYDAAVYAAATNFLQSKAAGQGSQWMGGKKGSVGGGGTPGIGTIAGGGSGKRECRGLS